MLRSNSRTIAQTQANLHAMNFALTKTTISTHTPEQLFSQSFQRDRQLTTLIQSKATAPLPTLAEMHARTQRIIDETQVQIAENRATLRSLSAAVTPAPPPTTLQSFISEIREEGRITR